MPGKAEQEGTTGINGENTDLLDGFPAGVSTMALVIETSGHQTQHLTTGEFRSIPFLPIIHFIGKSWMQS